MKVIPFVSGFTEKPPVLPLSPVMTYDDIAERSDFSLRGVGDPLLMSPTMIGQTWTDEAH